jgi:hypothetical protein
MNETIIKFTDVDVDGNGTDVSTLAKISGKEVTKETITKIENAISDYKRLYEGEWDTDGCLNAADYVLRDNGYNVVWITPSTEICF